MSARETVFVFSYGSNAADKWTLTDNAYYNQADETHVAIQRGGISISQEPASAKMELELTPNAEIVQFIRERKLGRGVKVEIKERVPDENLGGNNYLESTIWSGRVTSLDASQGPVTLVCEDASLYATRDGLRRRMQPSCPWVLYERFCGVNRDSFRRSSVVSAVDGAKMTVSAGWNGTVAKEKYRNGYCEWAHSETGITETRTIRNVVNDELLLDAKVRGVHIGRNVWQSEYDYDFNSPPVSVPDAQVYNDIDLNFSSNMDINAALNAQRREWCFITNFAPAELGNTGPANNNTRAHLRYRSVDGNARDRSPVKTYFEIDGGTSGNSDVVSWLQSNKARRLTVVANLAGSGFFFVAGLYMISATTRPAWADNPTVAQLQAAVMGTNNLRRGWPFETNVAEGDTDVDYARTRFTYKYAGGWRELTWDIPAGHRWVAMFLDVTNTNPINTGASITEIELQEFDVGTSVKIWPGCNHERTDCHNLFSNISNFGGQPNIPLKNPYAELLPFKQGE